MSRRRLAWPPGTRWLAVGIAAVVLALAVAWALFVPAADWLARHDVGSARGALLQTARDDARGRLLTLGAGLLAAGALVFTARNFTLSREGQVTDRYTKAIEQLGSDKLDVRIGGIYALERVARDSARDHPTVMEVLTAFIREHSRDSSSESGPDVREQIRVVRPDVQAAATVVGRRDSARDFQSVNLLLANLTGANLTGADLTGADLTAAVLMGADLRDAQLTDAELTEADLTDANLAEANLTEAELTGADLTAAILDFAKFDTADLTGADLTRASLARADLTRANLTGAHLTSAKLLGADLTRASLAGADLTGADLTGADLTGADLTGADLTGANLSYAKLDTADLTGAILTDAIPGSAALTNVKWSKDKAVPEGWKLDPNSGRLSREN